MKIALPETYPTGQCVLVPIDLAIAPLIAGMLQPFTERRVWQADSYHDGYLAIQEVIAAMTSNCMSVLVDEIRAFRGIKPEYASTPVEEQTSAMFNSLNDSFAKLLEMRGIMDDGWFSDTYTTLKDVVQVTRGLDQTNAVSLWDTVSGLITTSASGATLLTNIASMLSDVGETAVEGGLLTALIAIEASNAAIIQQQAVTQAAMYTTLNSILAALRGADPPADNILQALRGDTPADETRNIVEQLL